MEITKEFYAKQLEAGGFVRDESFPAEDPNQFQYKLTDKTGSGIFRYYIQEKMFAIDVHEMRFYQDTLVEMPEPKFLSIQYFRSVSGEELHPYAQLSPNMLRAYIGGDNRVYQAIYHKDIPVSSVSISVMPEFYEGYLREKLSGERVDFHRVFQRMTGGMDHPQLVLLLKQLQSYHGFGPSAKLFYEGKVLEAVALALEEARRSTRAKRSLRMTPADEANLNAAVRYIDNHYAFGVTLEQLSKIALMGTTKLKTAFKESVGCSVSEYIIRNGDFPTCPYPNPESPDALKIGLEWCEKTGADLLIATDLSIAEVAKAVGYERSDSFSSQFFRVTGFLPSEYRGLADHRDGVV